MAGIILALASLGWASPRVLAVLVAVLSLGWLVVAVGMRRPYLDLFRQALTRGTLDPSSELEELDLGSLEAVMQALSSREPTRAVAALELLEDRKRSRLIPGLILYHESEIVLVRALEIEDASKRTEWVPLIERLLEHPSEDVRVAAVRALARGGNLESLEKALEDSSPAVRAHAAFCIASADPSRDPLHDPTIESLLSLEASAARSARLALLDSVYDSADPRWAGLVLAMAFADDPEVVERASATMGRVKDDRFIPILIGRLALRDGRAAVREALVQFGDRGLDALEKAMRDPKTSARVRLHIPRSISRFGSQRAADILSEQLASALGGAVRYKVLRGLGRLVAEGKVKVQRDVVENEVRRNLIEHMRLLSLRVPLEGGQSAVSARDGGSGRLLVGLLDDKLRQSLERAFRLLQVVHKNEDMRSVYFALRSSDRRVRANALEFLDVLTGDEAGSQARRDIRALLRIVADDLSAAERVVRAAAFVPAPPTKYSATLGALIRDPDESVAALAAYHALELDIDELRDQVAQAVIDRPSLSFVSASPIRLPGGAEAHA
jgi:HEAT repeat protein